MKKSIYIKISDVPFELKLENPKLERYYEQFIISPQEDAIELEVTEDMFAFFPDESRRETELLWHTLLAGDELIKHDKLVFHGCAFEWKGKAFIFTAPSGVGKTTQYLLWKKLFGDDVSPLNGDKPILDFTEDGIFVQPSPWNGKEKIGEMRSAPLRGIIYLRQAEENRIGRLETKLAVQLLFEQVLYSAPDAQTVYSAAKLTEELIYSTKLWQLDNLGDEASAVLCHDTLEEEF